MAKVKTTYEFDENDVRRGLMLRFEELYGMGMGVVPDDFRFDIVGPDYDGMSYEPARIRCVRVDLK